MPSQVQRVFRHLFFEPEFDLIRGAEEAIRGHRVLDSLVRPMKVVPIDEMPDAPPRILDVQKHRRCQAFLPERTPKPFDLS
jgi:hypothetical protein